MFRYTLKRSGDFTVKTFGPNHCGTKDTLKMKYDLKVVCPTESLDDRGFLFDQTKVQTFFDGIEKTSLSCERFAAQCANKLFTQIQKENKKAVVLEMSLTLSPEPYQASLMFEYIPEQEELAA